MDKIRWRRAAYGEIAKIGKAAQSCGLLKGGKNYMERTVLFKSLVGSHNYNLNTENSDKDYKVFVLPTFEDIYAGVMYSKDIIGEVEDLDIHDFRRLENLLKKSNVNFLEILFSREVDVNFVDNNEEIVKNILDLFAIREEIARMNLSYLYDACYGTYYNKMKYVSKNSTVDYKSAAQAYRILDFLVRYNRNGFTSFKEVIYYQDEEKNREIILNIKQGLINDFEVLELITEKKLEVDKIKDKYRKDFNERTYSNLRNILENIFKIHLRPMIE